MRFLTTSALFPASRETLPEGLEGFSGTFRRFTVWKESNGAGQWRSSRLADATASGRFREQTYGRHCCGSPSAEAVCCVRWDAQSGRTRLQTLRGRLQRRAAARGREPRCGAAALLRLQLQSHRQVHFCPAYRYRLLNSPAKLGSSLNLSKRSVRKMDYKVTVSHSTESVLCTCRTHEIITAISRLFTPVVCLLCHFWHIWQFLLFSHLNVFFDSYKVLCNKNNNKSS